MDMKKHLHSHENYMYAKVPDLKNTLLDSELKYKMCFF